MSDMDYVFAVARIRVKETKLLTDADVRQMVSMKDDTEVLNYLIDKGWGDGSSKTAEEVLLAEEDKTWALMRELKIPSSIFDVLAYPKLYHNLKAGIKEVATVDVPNHIYYDIEGFDEERVKRIIAEKDYNALPEHMRAAAKQAYEVLVATGDGQRCDCIIDRACLEASLEAGKKSKNALLRDYEEETVAVTDIKIAVRSAKTGKSLNFLKEALAPCGSIDVNGLAVAASRSMENLLEFLEGRGYREAAEAIKESPSAFERWCDNRVIDTILPQKRNPASAGPIIAYYLARENEIKTARIILTAKANGFSEDSTRERVRKMYG